MKMLAISAAAFCIFFSETNMLCAQSLGDDIRDIFVSSLLPGGYTEGVELRRMLRSSDWRLFRKNVGDKEAFDAIYSLAFERTGGNIKHSLFASAVAVLDHRTIPIRLPFGGEVDLPLTLESDHNFYDRVRELPATLYNNSTNDRDKSQHFFFSAYFKHTTAMSWFVRMLGNLVEVGEQAFVIGGDNDPRDKHANADGAQFSNELSASPDAMPSKSLTPNP